MVVAKEFEHITLADSDESKSEYMESGGKRERETEFRGQIIVPIRRGK